MNKLHILYLLVLLPSFLFSQNTPNVPPGTIRMSDSLYIDQTPITNLMYLEFLSSIKSFWNPEMHERISKLPKYGVDRNFREINTMQTENAIANFDFLLSSKKGSDPLVQISKREAEIFCRWRTDMVMLLWAIRSRNETEREQYPSAIRYRLPRIEEYEKAKAHFAALNKMEINREKFPSELNAKNELSENFVLYDLAEITYDNELYGEKAISQVTVPNDFTGFRCICEVED